MHLFFPEEQRERYNNMYIKIGELKDRVSQLQSRLEVLNQLTPEFLSRRDFPSVSSTILVSFLTDFS